MKISTALILSGFHTKLLQDLSFFAKLFPTVFLSQTFIGTVKA